MKLSIAVALSHDSKLLILDEATSGLDPIVRDEILDVFLDFIQDESHSIFISSHIISDLEKICDYITFIHNGKIIFSEVKDELLDKYTIITAFLCLCNTNCCITLTFLSNLYNTSSCAARFSPCKQKKPVV